MSTAHHLSPSWRWPVIGTFVAIVATAVMDAVGLSGINFLPLIPLFIAFWYLQRLSRVEIGLTWGRGRDYVLALFYPTVVLALIGLIAWMSGAVNVAITNWANTLAMLVVSVLVTIALALLTEEGFFRGALWASLQRSGVAERGVWVWTSLAFAAWHLSTALLPTPFHLPLAQVPMYILNAAVIGFNWALMRQWSGSIVVTSVSHGVWNGLVYTLFGVGPTLGVLGIHSTGVFGPEAGLVGLALNLAFAAVLCLRPGFNRSRTLKAAMTQ
jgi:membrane protease YdiL (CAAX protease family)